MQFLKGIWDDALSETWKPYPQLVLTNDNKKAGEARGQGVSMVNLEKIKWINDTAKNIKQTIGYFSNPALAMDDRLPNRLNQLRGARIPSALVRDGRMPVLPVTWDYPLNEIAAVLQQEKQELTADIQYQSTRHAKRRTASNSRRDWSSQRRGREAEYRRY